MPFAGRNHRRTMNRLGLHHSDIRPTESLAVDRPDAPMLRRYVRRG